LQHKLLEKGAFSAPFLFLMKKRGENGKKIEKTY